MVRHRAVVLVLAAALTMAFSAPRAARAAQDAALEHPVIKPMSGASLLPNSTFEEFGRLRVPSPEDGRTVSKDAEGKYWHLEYQLEDRRTGRTEIMANYASEARRVGGEVLSQTATRLVFRIVRRGGGTTWARLDTRTNGAYEVDIIDEADLVRSVEFDAGALLEALHRTGKVAIYGILFDVDKADLRPGSGQVIDTVAAVLKSEPTLRLEVHGHTDATGAAERNRQLSRDRAQAVVHALALYGIETGRIVPRGFGPDQPVGDNSTEEGRQQNRRVELVQIK